MTWVPLFEIASKDFEADLALVKEAMGALERRAGHPGGYKLDAEAEFAMGWWFYTVHAKIGFVRDLVERMHGADPGARDEGAALRELQERLGEGGSGARARMHAEKPPFRRYWSWLMG